MVLLPGGLICEPLLYQTEGVLSRVIVRQGLPLKCMQFIGFPFGRLFSTLNIQHFLEGNQLLCLRYFCCCAYKVFQPTRLVGNPHEIGTSIDVSCCNYLICYPLHG